MFHVYEIQQGRSLPEYFFDIRRGFERSSRKSATPTASLQFVQVDLSGFLPKMLVNNNDLLMIYPCVLKCCTDS